MDSILFANIKNEPQKYINKAIYFFAYTQEEDKWKTHAGHIEDIGKNGMSLVCKDDGDKRRKYVIHYNNVFLSEPL